MNTNADVRRHNAEDSRKILGESSAALCRSGAAKLFQPEFTQNFNGGIPRTLGFYVAANIGNIDVIAFAGTFTQCFRNICIAKAFLFKISSMELFIFCQARLSWFDT